LALGDNLLLGRMKTSRRNFIAKSILATAGVSASLNSLGASNYPATSSSTLVKRPGTFSINIFSKNLHWLNYEDMASVVAEMGFDGIDLTVRPEGHVFPERVEDDLPKAVEAIKKTGLNVYMITSAITDAESPFAEMILKTASALGVSFYRMGWISYDEKISIEDNLKKIQTKLVRLAELNKKFKIQGHYQNHSGTSFGSPIWDLHKVLKEVNSPWLGSQYDVMHATVEGANSWPLGLRLIKPYIGSLDIKDFYWAKKDGRWVPQLVPLGEGVIDFKKYFKLIKDQTIEGPLSIHYEYPLGGAEHGAKEVTMPNDEIITAMKKDLSSVKKLLIEAGLRQY
jgi:L-ribulose-5-phosphate 3-epimerase